MSFKFSREAILPIVLLASGPVRAETVAEIVKGMEANEARALAGHCIFVESTKQDQGGKQVETMFRRDLYFKYGASRQISAQLDPTTKKPEAISNELVVADGTKNITGIFSAKTPYDGHASPSAPVEGLETAGGGIPGITPLSFGLTISGKPASQSIRSGRFVVEGTESLPLCKHTLKLVGHVEGMKSTVWVCPEMGYLTVKSEYRGEGGWVMTYTTTNLKKLNGIWVPIAGTRSAKQNSKLIAQATYTSSSFNLQGVKASDVSWNFPPNSEFEEVSSSKRYRIDSAGQKSYLP